MRKNSINITWIAIIAVVVFCVLIMVATRIIIHNYVYSHYSGIDNITVIDGDTFVINSEIVRLLCVQAPEKGEEGYGEAKDYLWKLVRDGGLDMQRGTNNPDRDAYNRSLRFVYNSDGNLVNALLVKDGYAKVFPYDGTDCSLLA